MNKIAITVCAFITFQLNCLATAQSITTQEQVDSVIPRIGVVNINPEDDGSLARGVVTISGDDDVAHKTVSGGEDKETPMKLAQRLYEMRDTDGSNKEQSVMIWKECADKGDSRAMFLLGEAYGNPANGKLYNAFDSYEAYLRGFNAGDMDCAYTLGKINLEGKEPYGKNMHHAAYFFEEYVKRLEEKMKGHDVDEENLFIAWPKKYREACRVLGNMYILGDPVGKDTTKGELLLKKSDLNNSKSAEWWNTQHPASQKDEAADGGLDYWIGTWYYSQENNIEGVQFDFYADGTMRLTRVMEQTIPMMGRITMRICQEGTYKVEIPTVKVNLDKGTTSVRVIDMESRLSSAYLRERLSKRLREMFEQSGKDPMSDFKEYDMIVMSPTGFFEDGEVRGIDFSFCRKKEDKVLELHFTKGIRWS